MALEFTISVHDFQAAEHTPGWNVDGEGIAGRGTGTGMNSPGSSLNLGMLELVDKSRSICLPP